MTIPQSDYSTLFDKRVLTIEGYSRDVAIEVFGRGTPAYPYYVKVWIDELYCNLWSNFDLWSEASRNVDLTTFMSEKGRLDYIWGALYGKMCKNQAFKTRWVTGSLNFYYDHNTLIDTIRLGTTCTRPDLVSWLHPEVEHRMPFIVDITRHAMKRYSIAQLGTISIEVSMIDRSKIPSDDSSKVSFQEYALAYYDYENNFDTRTFSIESHTASREMAQSFVTQFNKSKGEGLFYEHARLYNRSEYSFATATEYPVRTP